MISRLRAVLTPRAVFFLAALMLALWLIRSMAAGGIQTDLEIRVGKILSSIEGAGEVSVVIAMRASPAQTSTMGMTGGLREQIPSGAVAVIKGAYDPWIQTEITQALCALLGLPASSVSVISGGG